MTTWVALEDFTLREMSRRQKDSHCTISLRSGTYRVYQSSTESSACQTGGPWEEREGL